MNPKVEVKAYGSSAVDAAKRVAAQDDQVSYAAALGMEIPGLVFWSEVRAADLGKAIVSETTQVIATNARGNYVKDTRTSGSLGTTFYKFLSKLQRSRLNMTTFELLPMPAKWDANSTAFVTAISTETALETIGNLGLATNPGDKAAQLPVNLIEIALQPNNTAFVPGTYTLKVNAVNVMVSNVLTDVEFDLTVDFAGGAPLFIYVLFQTTAVSATLTSSGVVLSGAKAEVGPLSLTVTNERTIASAVQVSFGNGSDISKALGMVCRVFPSSEDDILTDPYLTKSDTGYTMLGLMRLAAQRGSNSSIASY